MSDLVTWLEVGYKNRFGPLDRLNPEAMHKELLERLQELFADDRGVAVSAVGLIWLLDKASLTCSIVHPLASIPWSITFPAAKSVVSFLSIAESPPGAFGRFSGSSVSSSLAVLFNATSV